MSHGSNSSLYDPPDSSPAIVLFDVAHEVVLLSMHVAIDIFDAVWNKLSVANDCTEE